MLPSLNHKKIKVTIQALIGGPPGNRLALPEREANSLIQAFLKMLAIQMSNAPGIVKDRTGADRTVSPNLNILFAGGPAANTNYGPVIGSGTTPPAMTDYELDSPLTTNVAHSITTFALETPDANTMVLAIGRTFTNNTGATLNIREVGLGIVAGAAPTYNFLGDRTLYSLDLPAGLPVTFTYRIYITL